MIPRERVLLAMNRKKPDKVPKEADFTPPAYELFKQKAGTGDPVLYFNMEMRGAGFGATTRRTDFSKYLGELPPGTTVDEWGVGHTPGSMHHFTKMVHPMQKFKTPSEVAGYPFPDIKENYRHSRLEEEVERLKRSGFAVGGSWGSIFETSWYMRGMEEFLADLYENPDLVTAILDKVTDICCFQAERMAQAGADILRGGDDVGTERAMMMSPQTWRRWLKPRLASVIAAAKKIKPDILFFYHSDGFIEPIIPDLIEVGVDILNPVQPECMDPAKLKKQYGDKLAFWGTMGTQSTMPFGTSDDVRKVVRERIETVGYDGGLLLAPTHVLEPEVPWENIVAFFDEIEKFHYY